FQLAMAGVLVKQAEGAVRGHAQVQVWRMLVVYYDIRVSQTPLLYNNRSLRAYDVWMWNERGDAFRMSYEMYKGASGSQTFRGQNMIRYGLK
ncbi:MAG: hypothetical protein M0Q42_11280, partial [Xanthomonadales bacterium]|nr:hypothetical protein [Xanthomonadales bacterium]